MGNRRGRTGEGGQEEVEKQVREEDKGRVGRRRWEGCTFSPWSEGMQSLRS